MTTPDKNVPHPSDPSQDANAWAAAEEQTLHQQPPAEGESRPGSDTNEPDPLVTVEEPEAGGATARTRGQRLRAGGATIVRSRWTQVVAALLIGAVIGGGVVGLVGRDHDGRQVERMVQSENGNGGVPDRHGNGRQNNGGGDREGNRPVTPGDQNEIPPGGGLTDDQQPAPTSDAPAPTGSSTAASSSQADPTPDSSSSISAPTTTN